MKSLLETMFGAIIAMIVMMISVNLTDSIVAVGVKGTTDMRNDRSVRAMNDEMQLHLRNSSRILESTTVNGTTYTTGPTTLVVAAPAYNASQGGYFIPGQDDTIVFHYNSANQEMRQTIVTSPGTARPTRGSFTIGRNLSSFAFTYNCREMFTASSTGSSLPFTLNTAPVTGSVKVYVNGAAKTATVSGSVVTVTSSLVTGDSVQIFYNPQAVSSTARITEVTWTGQQSIAVARGSRTTTSLGSARLRNYRN